ncbi:MAG: hypothetical protein ACYC27_12395 [Armatimonadota bacterium]
MDKSFVAKLLRLMILTPDIVEMILAGRRAEWTIADETHEGSTNGVGWSARTIYSRTKPHSLPLSRRHGILVDTDQAACHVSSRIPHRLISPWHTDGVVSMAANVAALSPYYWAACDLAIHTMVTMINTLAQR